MQVTELPRWPSKGNRRKLEALWVEELERRGWSNFDFDATTEGPLVLFTAIEQFNNGLFWECHETLEDVWRNTPYPQRFFYHAIIKAAVGFYHLSRHNRRGAGVKLADSVRLLGLLPPTLMGVNTDQLRQECMPWQEWSERAGPIDWKDMEGDYPRVVFT